ncbi:MAG: MATE family efflux transporter [Alphaproteobacteria bacterium]|nr:MATE family efflux transporter [Alphaproteobacteria bacterium]
MKPSLLAPTRATIRRDIVVFCLPVLVSNLTVPLVGAVDTAIAGHLPASSSELVAAAIGGVGLAGVLFGLVFWTFGFLRMSATGLTAQAVGIGDESRSSVVFGRGLVIAVLCGGLILVLFPYVLPVILDAQAAESDARNVTATYAETRVWSSPAVLVNHVLVGRFFGLGNARQAMVHQIAINLTNIALNYLFAIELGWGIFGIALGTVVADYLGVGVGLLLLSQKGWPVRVPLARIARNWGEFLQLNSDIMLRTLALLAAYFLFNRESAQLGTEFLAANAIILQFLSLTAFGLDGIAFAMESMVGRVWGRINQHQDNDDKAGGNDHVRDESDSSQSTETTNRKQNRDRAWAELAIVIKEGHLIAAIVACGFSLLFWLFGDVFVRLFTDDAFVQSMVARYWVWLVFLPITGVWCWTWDGIFFGAALGRLARNSMLIVMVVFVLLIILVEQLSWGNDGLWIAYHVFSLGRGLALWVAWRWVVVPKHRAS